ncbi:CAT9 [Symbiodinium pilosum]|uniref:CAT9 protein n=1 Tax=Symbiodinium pilosum TaxID=2952 RepID=A0A812TYJ8_SYMPI|nr:CAT9 [Symbiodinium pilosum]
MQKRTRLRVALCFLAMGGWTASFVPRPVAGEVVKVMVVLPAFIADQAMAQEATRPPTSPPTGFPAFNVETAVYTAGVSFLSIVGSTLVQSFFGRFNDKNDLQFQALGKQVDDVKTKLGKFEDKLDVVIASALISVGAAGSFFLFKP